MAPGFKFAACCDYALFYARLVLTVTSQPAFTSSKKIMKAGERRVKFVQR